MFDLADESDIEATARELRALAKLLIHGIADSATRYAAFALSSCASTPTRTSPSSRTSC